MAVKSKNTIWKTAAYIRLSREDGDKLESESVTNQKQIISDFISSQHDLGDYTEFIDDGATGTNFNRPGFQEMLSKIKIGQVNCVIVKDLSRFGRNYIETGTFMEQFSMCGVRFISVTDNIDSFTKPNEMDSIIVPIKNLLNDSYSRDISVKVRTALKAKMKRGEFIGSFAPYGYLKDPNDKTKLVVNEEVAPFVRNIFKWFAEGMSKSGIVKKLNELQIVNPLRYRMKKDPTKKHNIGHVKKTPLYWDTQIINMIMRNPIYCGHMVQGKQTGISYKNRKGIKLPKEDWIVVENTHEPLVEPELFEKVQGLFKLRTRETPKTHTVHLFSGLLKCADCGESMDRASSTVKGRHYAYYRCSTHYRQSKEACSRHTIKEQDIMDIVLKLLQTQISLFCNADEMLKQVDTVTKRKSQAGIIQTQLSKAQRELDDMVQIRLDLHTDLKKKLIDEDEYVALKLGYTEKINKLTDAITALKSEIENLDNQEAGQNEWIERFKQYGNIDSLSRELVTGLIERIHIHENKRITIEFKFRDEFEELMKLAENEGKELGIKANGQIQEQIRIAV